MSLLAKLFRSKAPETLESQIARLNHADSAHILDTATSAENDALRIAAIQRVDSLDTLLALIKDKNGQIAKTAKQRLGELLDQNTISVTSLQSKLSDHQAILDACAYSSTVGNQLVDSIEEEDALSQLAINGATTQLRQSAALKLHSYDILLHTQKQIKNKDKAVYKILKTKLEGFKEQKLAEQKIAQEIDGICVQAETLAKRNVDDIFHARKAQIETAWSEHQSRASTQANTRYQTAMATCQQKLDDIKAKEDEEKAAIEADRAAKKEVYTALENLSSLVEQLFTHPTPKELAPLIQEARTQVDTTMTEAKERGLTVATETKQADDLCRRADEVLASLEQHGPFHMIVEQLKEATDHTGHTLLGSLKNLVSHAKALQQDTHPDWLTQAEAQYKAWEADIRAQKAESKKITMEVNELIRKGQWAADKGYVGRARAILRDLEAKAESLPSAPAHIETRIEDLKTAIDKLGDWHDFAVTPKKQALVEDMQALVGSRLEPQVLAKKIKTLQEKWRELSKGGSQQEDPLWDQFHAASNEAYEPCKQHFDKENAEREENLAKRKQLIEQMQIYDKDYDWDNANWKEVEKTIRVAREAWQSYWPIPRKQIDAVQTTFDAIMNHIYDRLSAYYDQNKQKKSGLIKQAEELESVSDINNAIEKAKLLQSQWKSIGSCRRKDDQELWKTFRRHCDTVFERRQQESDAQNAERTANLAEAESILAELESISEQSGDAFWAARSKLDELTDRYQNVGELPREKSKGVSHRYQKALSAINDTVDEEKRSAEHAMWQSIFDGLNKLLNAEQAGSSADIDQILSSMPKCPASIRDALDSRHALSKPSSDQPEASLRKLCVKSEIINDIETPASDKSLKMALQVEQLQAGLGQVLPANTDTMTRLLCDWIADASHAVSDYPSLESRFKSTWGLLV